MSGTRRRAALIATVFALPAALVAGILFAAAAHRSLSSTSPSSSPAPAGPVVVVAPANDDANTRAVCARILGALPTTLAGRASRPVSTAPDRVVAWGAPAIVLRCGVGPPGAAQGETVIRGTTWYAEDRTSAAVFVTKGREVTVELSVPRGAVANPAEIVASISDDIARTDRSKP
jgi:hypothetical protein